MSGPGRVLALDLGSVRIGVAASDATAVLASPRTTVARTGDADADRRRLVALVEEEEAVVVVVGLPLNMDGTRGPAARAAEQEAAGLRAVLDVPVELADERLTTVVADRSLMGQGRRAPARRKVVDQTAAAILLQTWLDGPRGARLRSGRPLDGPARAPEGSVDG